MFEKIPSDSSKFLFLLDASFAILDVVSKCLGILYGMEIFQQRQDDPATYQNLTIIPPVVYIIPRVDFSKNLVVRIRKLKISTKNETTFSCRLLRIQSVEELEGVENKDLFGTYFSTIFPFRSADPTTNIFLESES